MKKYIPKSALVAEIERLRENQRLDDRHGQGVLDGLHAIEKFLNDLEVKEVDLGQEIELYWKQCDLTWCKDAYTMTHIRTILSAIAKHFFELGLKAQKGE